MGLFNLSKRIAAGRIEQLHGAPTATTPARALPFNARIGALLELVRADFALLARSLVRPLQTAQQPIVAVSRLKLPADEKLRLHRNLGNVD